ncbi:MAG: hypothetical protein ACM3SP_23210 [Chloroflexota bacterium]
MRKDPFLNFCFLMLVLIFFTIQHSASPFAPAEQDRALSYSENSRRPWLALDGKAQIGLYMPANLSRAAELLDRTWRRVKIFDEWVIDYNTSRWEIFRASNPAETDLLRARFYVANAEVFTAAVSEKDRAVQELTRATKWLLAAQPLVKPELTHRLKTIQQEIVDAESNERAATTSSAVPFETIKANLDRLIELLRVANT